MTPVRRWTGCGATALRTALRQSRRDFAAHLGVAARTVSKWEAGGVSVCPRPEMQAALDTVLRRGGAEVESRFELLLQKDGDDGDHDVSAYLGKPLGDLSAGDASGNVVAAEWKQVELHKATCLILAGNPSEGARHVVRTVQALAPGHGQDALVRRTAGLALDVIPDNAVHLSAVSEARDLLALPARQS